MQHHYKREPPRPGNNVAQPRRPTMRTATTTKPRNPRKLERIAGFGSSPIVGYEGAIRGTIVEDAGIALVPVGDHQALGSALRDILANAALWQQMHERSLHIQRKYLSWDVIGAQFIRLLSVQKGGDESPTVL